MNVRKYLTTCFSLCGLSAVAQHDDLQLWYDKPAVRWEEYLPLGNGRIGMMPSGGVADESIVLNEISMWSGSPEDPNNYDAHKSVAEIQRLLAEGKNDLAEALVNENFVCKGAGSGHGRAANLPYGCFQNFGFLNFLHFVEGEPTDYKRTLNLDRAIATTSFTADGIGYRREYFTSFAQNTGIVRLSSDKKAAISFSLHFYREENLAEVKVEEDGIRLAGSLPDGKGGRGLAFAGGIRVVAKGGTKQVHDHQVIVKNADEVWVYFTASTSYYGHDPVKEVARTLAKAESWKYAKLLKSHERAYRPLFDRVSLSLRDEVPKTDLPTDVRIREFHEHPERDNGLAALYYQFGRYLTLSSAAPNVPNALPPNLQGLWAHPIQTPWNGDYHLNINAQMNHWGVETGNLSEYHRPFIDLIRRIAKEGEKTAKAYYNAPGWVVYMMTNVWGYSAPGEQASWGASTASGWLCNHLWEHYLFTEDKTYLAEIYPVLKGAAEFYRAVLVEDPRTGQLVTSPSVSPENAFKMPNGRTASVAMGPTIDNQIVRELYLSVIAADSVLSLRDGFAAALAGDIERLPPPVVVSESSGRVMEWLEDYEEAEPQHRHVSHLYGLHPANFISPVRTPEWAEAARKTLEARGDGGTGWSRAWKILFWARLHDGDHALEILRQLLKPAFGDGTASGKAGPGTYPNLFCAHPPFQIDGNFGGSAGIAEMLLQSHDGHVHLLPALPSAWREGRAKGLKARGNLTVDIVWKDGKVTEYRVQGGKGGKIEVLADGKRENVFNRAKSDGVFRREL